MRLRRAGSGWNMMASSCHDLTGQGQDEPGKPRNAWYHWHLPEWPLWRQRRSGRAAHARHDRARDCQKPRVSAKVTENQLKHCFLLINCLIADADHPWRHVINA